MTFVPFEAGNFNNVIAAKRISPENRARGSTMKSWYPEQPLLYSSSGQLGEALIC